MKRSMTIVSRLAEIYELPSAVDLNLNRTSWPALGGPPKVKRPLHKIATLNRFNSMREELCPAAYIITNKRNGTLYIDVTSALYDRIWEHKNGLNSGFSKQYGLDVLVWYEHHPSMLSAIHREKRLKKWPRAWKLNLINSMNPGWQDLHEHIDANANLVEEFASPKVGAR